MITHNAIYSKPIPLHNQTVDEVSLSIQRIKESFVQHVRQSVLPYYNVDRHVNIKRIYFSTIDPTRYLGNRLVIEYTFDWPEHLPPPLLMHGQEP